MSSPNIFLGNQNTPGVVCVSVKIIIYPLQELCSLVVFSWDEVWMVMIKVYQGTKVSRKYVVVKLSGNIMLHTQLDSFFICEVFLWFDHCLEFQFFKFKNQ